MSGLSGAVPAGDRGPAESDRRAEAAEHRMKIAEDNAGVALAKAEEFAEKLTAAERTRNDLDALVSRFCKAAGEPVPVEAIERIEWLVATLARVRERAQDVLDGLGTREAKAVAEGIMALIESGEGER